MLVPRYSADICSQILKMECVPQQNSVRGLGDTIVMFRCQMAEIETQITEATGQFRVQSHDSSVSRLNISILVAALFHYQRAVAFVVG